MKKEVNNTALKVTMVLNELITELKDCQAEKEEILSAIELFKSQGKLEKNYPLIRERMKNNVERFEKVVAKIEKVNKSIK